MLYLIPLEMVSLVDEHNYTLASELVGEKLSATTLERMNQLDLLSALSLCEEVYGFSVAVDDKIVVIYFPRYSAYRIRCRGTRIPLYYEDPYDSSLPVRAR